MTGDDDPHPTPTLFFFHQFSQLGRQHAHYSFLLPLRKSLEMRNERREGDVGEGGKVWPGKRGRGREGYWAGAGLSWAGLGDVS